MLDTYFIYNSQYGAFEVWSKEAAYNGLKARFQQKINEIEKDENITNEHKQNFLLEIFNAVTDLEAAYNESNLNKTDLHFRKKVCNHSYSIYPQIGRAHV